MTAVVVAHHAKRDEVDQLGNHRIDLARHDRRTGLQRRQVDLGKTGARTGSQQDQIARDLRQLDRDALQRRGIGDEALLVPGRREHVGGRHDRLAGQLREMRRALLRVALRDVDARCRSRWLPC